MTDQPAGAEEPDDDGSYSLVLPFINVASQGGPYDDISFVAGVEVGRLFVSLAALAELPGVLLWEPGTAFRRDNVAQIDLVAMHYGLRMDERRPSADPLDDSYAEDAAAWLPEWAFLAFSRGYEQAPDD